jgi:GMP synthase-like glutamine amidotransferase
VSDRRLLVVEHEADAGLGRLAPFLGPVDVRRPYVGDRLPVDVRDGRYRGLIVLGGAMGAHDDDIAPWLPATRALLADAVEVALPTWGICLGAQLLAVATGGVVERGPTLEVGLCPAQPLPAAGSDPLVGPAVRRGAVLSVPQWHHDAVVALPPAAELLVTAEPYQHQAFRLGPCAWGVQYHPEVSAEDFAEWLRDGTPEVVAAGLDPRRVAAALAEAEASLAELAADHAVAFRALTDALAAPA